MSTELTRACSQHIDVVQTSASTPLSIYTAKLLHSKSKHQPSQKFGKYTLGKQIGKGRHCEVRQAFKNSRTYAIKIFPEHIMTHEKITQIGMEIKTLKNLNHPNIVKILQIVIADGKVGFVMNQAENGDLFHYISENGPLPEKLSRKIMVQLFKTLKYLHTRSIVHRDIKPENILLDQDMNPILTDFEFSLDFSRQGFPMVETVVGSPTYCPPEAIMSKMPYDAIKGDIWAIGITLYTACCGYLPFNDNQFTIKTSQEIAQLYLHIQSTELQFPPFLTTHLQNLINGILDKNPQHRLNLQTCISHKWFVLEDLDFSELSFSSSSSESDTSIDEPEETKTQVKDHIQGKKSTMD